jgi:hypothetical protein
MESNATLQTLSLAWNGLEDDGVVVRCRLSCHCTVVLSAELAVVPLHWCCSAMLHQFPAVGRPELAWMGQGHGVRRQAADAEPGLEDDGAVMSCCSYCL